MIQPSQSARDMEWEHFAKLIELPAAPEQNSIYWHKLPPAAPVSQPTLAQVVENINAADLVADPNCTNMLRRAFGLAAILWTAIVIALAVLR